MNLHNQKDAMRLAAHLTSSRLSRPVSLPATASRLFLTLRAGLLCAALSAGFAAPALAESPERGTLADVLMLDTTVSADVTPDLATVTLAATREGTDAPTVTKEVNQLLARALAEAKATPGVLASTGGYATYPRFDNKGTRTGWQVRAELVLKSKDFGTLGKLAGKLGGSLQIVGSGFEVSPELRAAEEEKLIERGVQAFQNKARATVKALGLGGYSLREITIGTAQLQGGGPRPLYAKAAMAESAAAPMPIESGPVQLTLTVGGSVQMHR